MVSNPALISIIMPFKNSQDFLLDCIKSIQGQSYTNWELLAVDDFSDDKSAEIIHSYFKNDERVKVISNQGKGIIDALHTALNSATGDYISRMDSDDIMPENRLENMLGEILQSPANTVITGLVQYFSDSEISEGYLKYENWLNSINTNADQWSHIYRECVIASPNWLIRKSDLLKINGFKDLEYPEDYDLVLKWYENGFRIHCLNELTLLWREHASRTSRISSHYNQESFFRLKIKSFLQIDYKSQKLILWGSGKKARLTGSILDENHIPFHWMDLDPKKFRNGINGHSIKPFESIQNFNPDSTQLLLAVHPPENQKIKLEAYLEQCGFKPGKNYWYL